MGIALAFLSGKGGSGKTTLALSMADLLSRCNIHVLLVDCDLSTNGATYFYEHKLNQTSLAFNELLEGKYWDNLQDFIQINSSLDFIPSVPQVSDQYLNILARQNADYESILKDFCSFAKEHYDVILFDCQAGYTELLNVLLPLMDEDLFVLEADGISGSALRSLHLKIGNFLGRAKLYQVFNKASQEEYEIYSKIVGTFFTNIGTLLFDWKIRQSFSRSQIPDIESTSAKYGADLCDICKILFTDDTLQKK